MCHDECRRRVCAVCYDEMGRRAEPGRNMSRKQEEGVRRHINPTFSVADPSLPIGLCLSCRIGLAQHMRQETEATTCLPDASSSTCYKAPNPLPVCSSYSNPILRETRSAEGCGCRICSYAHSSGLAHKGLLDKPKKQVNILKICGHCHAELYPGLFYQENYANCKLLFELIGLRKIDFIFTGDCKVRCHVINVIVHGRNK